MIWKGLPNEHWKITHKLSCGVKEGAGCRGASVPIRPVRYMVHMKRIIQRAGGSENKLAMGPGNSCYVWREHR